MKIGYACISLGSGYKTTRRLTLKNFSKQNFRDTALLNLIDFKKILQYNIDNNLFIFRISSDIIPFASHTINNFQWWNSFENELKDIGDFIKSHNIRVSMHPGQYTVLNSPKENVVQNSIKDIEYHTKFLDSLQLDYSHKLILHIGGIYGNKPEALKRFINNFSRLSLSAQKRLTIENDDKLFTLEDVIYVSNKIKIPVIFDNLHHKCNPSLENKNIIDILNIVEKTWSREDGAVKIHYSQQNSNKRTGAHSTYINLKSFMNFYHSIEDFDIDIMLEVKDKDISAIKCSNTIFSNNDLDLIKSQFENYKYTIKEKSYYMYSNIENQISKTICFYDFYNIIDSLLANPYDSLSTRKVLNEIIYLFYDIASSRDKNYLEKLSIENTDYSKIKEKLSRLSTKYNIKSLLSSYYFYY
ncbi:hypothetical protein SH2C18_37410 [Clostridium sediminicola]|uniref:UV DNA damage repair endonuclease UvsE n=1 Tax=Clostridium sediminicola TaxID=3114879 RepID=UPI0031F2736F